MRDGKGRSATKDNNEDDDLHVVISGDSEEALDHAEALVRRLLVPVEEGKNDIKRKQLRKLAELNGTLKDNNYGFEREQREGRLGPPGGIVCRWCGETSHPSSDCTMRGRGPPPSTAPPQGLKVVTQEYYDLMMSIGEDVSGMVVQGSQSNNNNNNGEDGGGDEGFDAFLASVGVDSSHPQPNTTAGGGSHHSAAGGNFYPQSSSGGPPSDRYGSASGGGGGGGGGGFQGRDQYPPPQASDDIPPWERDEFAARGNTNNNNQNSNSAAGGLPSDAPAPWDL